MGTEVMKMNKNRCVINAILASAVIIALVLAMGGTASAQQRIGVTLHNEQIKFSVVNESVSVANYTDDTQEPEGWQLFPALFWDSDGNGIYEDNESIGYALSPSVHFSIDGERHHFWALHQSVMQDPGDATVVSSGWISEPNIYASKVEDADGLIRVESNFSVFSGNSYFEQAINVTSNASTTLTNVSLIVYLGIDINGFFNDFAFIDAENNNMFKAKDNETGVWFGAYPNIATDNFEIGEWNDGPLEGEDTWQHCLNDSLDGTSAMCGDVEGALEFYLGDIAPGGSKNLTIYYSFAMNESDLYIPGVSKIFDTGEGTYPSIMGIHNGTITPSHDVMVNRMYTYPCAGTGGHTEYVWIYGNGINESASWNSYSSDWHYIRFDNPFVLEEGKKYNYTIITGSYPQIIHETPFNATGGTINCTEFIDANGKVYHNWIPAIKLSA